MPLTDVSPSDSLAVLLGALVYGLAQWVRHRVGHRPPDRDQAQAWAEGFRAGAQAATTGYPEANPYVGEPITLSGMDRHPSDNRQE